MVQNDCREWFKVQNGNSRVWGTLFHYAFKEYRQTCAIPCKQKIFNLGCRRLFVATVRSPLSSARLDAFNNEI